MLKTTVKFLLLTEAFAVGTFAFGWWAVPLLAFLWAVFVGTRSRPVFFATICATAAWCGILLLDAARGPLVAVAERFGGVFGFRPIVLMVVTILFPALLGCVCALANPFLARSRNHRSNSSNPAVTFASRSAARFC